MKDKYLYLALAVLIPVNVILTYRNIKGVNMSKNSEKFTEIRVLPVNEDKELVKPDEVRQFVLAMADLKGVDVDMVDKIGYCESRWKYDAVSRTGKYQGIFQISEIHQLGDDRLDVIKSTKWSLDKMKKEGFAAWECSVL